MKCVLRNWLALIIVRHLALVGLGLWGVLCEAHSQTVLTFDDLSPGTGVSNHVVISNGYGGLQWSGFAVLNGTTQVPTSGYYTGMVSPDNVAFNYDEFDRNAVASSSTPFNFNSGYFTSAFETGLSLQVQGYVGTTLTYDNTYTLDPTGPELLDFNYLGVDEVKFNVSGDADIFVMDNMSITMLPEPNVWALVAVGALIIAGGGALRRFRPATSAG